MSDRIDGRTADALRPVSITPGFIENPAGSVLMQMGKTRVICTASVENDVPRWMKGQGRGWVTAEYGMLPGSTDTRTDREAARGKVGGRTMEIQRLIGRSLRAVVDMEALGENTVRLDCDVIEADGGTRTASITGAWVAFALACESMIAQGVIEGSPSLQPVAAVSVGVVGGEPMLDLCYREDSRADVDMNVVMTGDGRFVEVQGTAEGEPFSREVLSSLTDLASAGIEQLVSAQKAALAGAAG